MSNVALISGIMSIFVYFILQWEEKGKITLINLHMVIDLSVMTNCIRINTVVDYFNGL